MSQYDICKTECVGFVIITEQVKQNYLFCRLLYIHLCADLQCASVLS